MKQVIAAFGLGALMAGGVAFVMSQRNEPTPPAAPPAPVAAAAPVIPTPEPAPAPAPAPAAEPEPTRPAKKAREPKRTVEPVREPEPVRVARADPAPPPAPVVPLPPAPAPAAPAPAPVPEPQVKPAVTEPPKPPVTLSPPPGTRTDEPKRLPRESKTVTLSQGMLIHVRLLERLTSDVQQPGDTFAASLSEPIIVDRFIIAEKDARCEGRVVDAKKAGRVRGLASMSVELTRITTSDGQKITVQTAPFEKAGPDTTKQDAAKVGAGAAIGAAIGAIAGGGKGAGIGAAAGGAAGGGTVIAGRGKPAEMPVETRIGFRLNAPVTITEQPRK